MVKQVQIVSILMIVQGALASLMGVVYAAMGPAMFALMSMDKNRPKNADDEKVATIMTVVYVALGAVALLAGILNIIAGIRSLKFRGRTFAIVALISNVFALGTCYCIPTALGVMIYGLIVMFNSDVARAFTMASEGAMPAEIRARFDGSSRRHEDDDYGDRDGDERDQPPPRDDDRDERFRP